jgi:hypothetical protein
MNTGRAKRRYHVKNGRGQYLAKFKIAQVDPWVDDIKDARRFYSRFEASDWVIGELHRVLQEVAASQYGIVPDLYLKKLKVVREDRPRIDAPSKSRFKSMGAIDKTMKGATKAKLPAKFFDETVGFPPLASVGIDMAFAGGDETVVTVEERGPNALAQDLRILRGIGKTRARRV